ncbi:hypothetical protein EW145_g7063 [Phellinidium pouzarii]|uniref:AAA+ ATPase domain-containing protein n=1 Tax=Phellinidium pouzarii TaxID=167371 RepID=A0A4S4KPN3_9AGAM|nr:hypothetical protein EW145_g7063 [Phellinidium pouzarii]
MAPKSKLVSNSSSRQTLKNKCVRLPAAKKKTLKPLLSVSRPPAFDLSGKGKANAEPRSNVISLLEDSAKSQMSAVDDRLWVDRYEPQSETEVAVHKRKVEDVRQWFQEAFEGGPTGKLKKYRRVLVLTGPAGTAKTTTVRLLAKEMDFDISEWRSTMEESYNEEDYERESLNHKFETFLARAATCRSLLGGATQSSTSSSPLSRIPSITQSTASSGSSKSGKQIVLLEDLPNILHQPTQDAFHASLESFVSTPAGTPLVIIISDVSTRAEVRDENLAHGNGSYRSAKDTVDIRTVLPPGLTKGPFVTQIAFNPIAPTLMLRALQAMLVKHCADVNVSQNNRLTKEDLNMIVETSNGDIRSAVMALQFSCILDGSIHHGKGRPLKGKSKNTGINSRSLMEAVTRREQALALFHLMGKVLYNKRKGDPPSSSATVRDKNREQELDAGLGDLLPLHPWLSEHQRRPSRVDVDTLYADSPIDTGLFSLYIQQNYPQFCDVVEECGDLSDWLSWIDSSGGEHVRDPIFSRCWYQTNPHQFHLLTLGTLHALPSPVKTRIAEDALGDVWTWLQDSGSVRWAKTEIALEMGAVLKARTKGGGSGSIQENGVPPMHSAFSALIYTSSSSSGVASLDDNDNEEYDYEVPESMDVPQQKVSEGGMWLTNDDIEDF